MLSIKFVGSSNIQLVGPGNQWKQIPAMSGYNRIYCATQPLLECPKYGYVPTETSHETPIGYLSQGNLAWGRLRDKDVHHVKVDGTVEFSSYEASTTRLWPFPSSNNYMLGRACYKSSSAYLTYIDKVPWGTSATWQVSTEAPLGTSSSHGAATSASPVVCTVVVKCSGNMAWVAVRSEPYTITFADGYVFSYGQRLMYHSMIRRVLVSNSWTYKSREFTRGTNTVVGPNGVTYPWDNVPLDETLWTPYVTGAAGSISDKSYWVTVSETDYAKGYYELIERLEHGRILRTFARTLAGTPIDLDYTELSKQILSQHKVIDTNLLLTIFDLAVLRLDSVPWRNLWALLKDGYSSVKRGITTVKAFRKVVRSSLKNGSGTFLGIEYGVMPTLSDADKVWGAVKNVAEYRSVPTRLHARNQSQQDPVGKGSLKSIVTLTVEVDSLEEDFLPTPMKAISGAWKVGMWPTFEMAWDFVPFSFVVDWFKNVQHAAESLDVMVWEKYFPIKYVIVSEKRTWVVSLNDLMPDLSGLPSANLTFTDYRRWCEDSYPLPPVDLGDENDPFNHWIEAGALIVQKRK